MTTTPDKLSITSESIARTMKHIIYWTYTLDGTYNLIGNTYSSIYSDNISITIRLFQHQLWPKITPNLDSLIGILSL